MISTPRARRMIESMPSYYHGNDFHERIIQSLANELDRMRARAEAVRRGLIPSLATDELGMLGTWEAILELPVEPVGVAIESRRDKVQASLQKLDSGSARDTADALGAATGGTGLVILENEPDPLRDTIQIPYAEGSYNAAQVEAIARKMWPAHRDIVMRYDEGFIVGVSRLGEDAL